jgi:hypothetical protein
MWNEDDLLEIMGNAVEDCALGYDAEQAVRGIDYLTENELRDWIRGAFSSREILVTQEQRYPDAQPLARLTEGCRCDFVLLRSNLNSGDLQAKTGYWLEVKRLAQFLESGPNWWYEHALLQTIPQDIYKLANDSKLFYAGLLLILFVATQDSGFHDLMEWKRSAIAKGCPIGVPRIHNFSINNRLGNGHAFVALFPLRRL